MQNNSVFPEAFGRVWWFYSQGHIQKIENWGFQWEVKVKLMISLLLRDSSCELQLLVMAGVPVLLLTSVSGNAVAEEEEVWSIVVTLLAVDGDACWGESFINVVGIPDSSYTKDTQKIAIRCQVKWINKTFNYFFAQQRRKFYSQPLYTPWSISSTQLSVCVQKLKKDKFQL